MGDIDHVLLTSSGRRSYLVDYFKDVLGPEGTVSATDYDPLAPIFETCDEGFVVPSIDDEGYLDVLRRVCDDFDVDLLVPANDRELHLLAGARSSFHDIGTHVLVSSPKVIQIANDKLRTYEFLSDNDIPTPYTTDSRTKLEEVVESGRLSYPVIVKPRFGSGSNDIYVAESRSELDVFWRRIDQPIVQERLIGQEFGVDVFNGSDGTPRSIVPRKKIETRAGETDKAVSVDDQALLDLGSEVGAALGHYGPVDVDCFGTGHGPFVLELNARFGGGYPLTHLAGGGFVEAALTLVDGKDPTDRVGGFDAGVIMTKTYQIDSPDLDGRDLHRFD
jgi:carbamoyl-phosphate synthase large subunit